MVGLTLEKAGVQLEIDLSKLPGGWRRVSQQIASRLISKGGFE
jgi:hypothetical protein